MHIENYFLTKLGCNAIPNNPPSNTSAVLNVTNGSSNNFSESITLIVPTFSLMNILSSAKSMDQGFSRFSS